MVIVMIFNVHNYDGIYCFGEQESVAKERLWSLKLTWKDDVARRQGATRCDNRSDSNSQTSLSK